MLFWITAYFSIFNAFLIFDHNCNLLKSSVSKKWEKQWSWGICLAFIDKIMEVICQILQDKTTLLSSELDHLLQLSNQDTQWSSSWHSFTPSKSWSRQWAEMFSHSDKSEVSLFLRNCAQPSFCTNNELQNDVGCLIDIKRCCALWKDSG